MVHRSKTLSLLFSFLLLFLFHLTYAQATLLISSPIAYEVFQRADNAGTIVIRGHSDMTGTYTISASWNGLSSGVLWQGDTSYFEAEWTGLPVGQSDLVITIGETSLTISPVSIGDVYIIAGQSNAVGAGRHDQMYTNSLGLSASLFNFRGWGILQDPTGRTYARLTKGSLWPLLATYILESGIPVAFVPTAEGGTNIGRWQPGDRLYVNMTTQIEQLAPPYARAVLWQQGESSADRNGTAKDYSVYLSTMALDLYQRYQISMLAAYLYNNPHVNDGIDMAIRGGAPILAGADLRDLPYDAHNHYTTDENLQAEAWLWWQALIEAGVYTGEPLLP